MTSIHLLAHVVASLLCIGFLGAAIVLTEHTRELNETMTRDYVCLGIIAAATLFSVVGVFL